ncbi:uncharacterized protein LOC134789503 isoform X1 [Cydia splendana]|uniref:uncharacterized protein LOC134789503 isoform X1 n=1 Tax=Cydia splendana TaxID=1100963 RepID=UPI00212079C4
MQRLTLFLLSAVLAVALAEGQYYVPRAYYTIDQTGHASVPVPLQRLRRSFYPYPGPGSDANANANANAWGGGNANANANANAGAGREFPGGSWGVPGAYGAAKPMGPGMTRRMFGAVNGANSVSASSSVDVDGEGNGSYDVSSSVGYY